MKIKVLTYNIFIRPPPIKTNEDDFKDERLTSKLNLNINQTYFNEYEALINILQGKDKDIVIDLAKEANNGQFPITYGEYKVVNKVKIPFETKKLKIDIKSSSVQKFSIDNQIFTQLSDHFGVSTIILYG
ncbi:hypothetical protein IMG5_121790 [Ichthyophthirius multifiliis]|uniref:Uncharacterized protein n=1 Tax=Ichthyophthirius multifiliis TaxID=5932 RepID=G0QV68_ICHMU|nr:hypothetical protein IMG5_121790 [Ichthyophthirius multifiliis]EGR30881.1 hypothetical protein IMG5_121790 [Ichthyophthirius multifiliis]|eukprot:XP_004032468.1 hypothetical protein IMG5_121790 [Ichthyophthirius multifiliis]